MRLKLRGQSWYLKPYYQVKLPRQDYKWRRPSGKGGEQGRCSVSRAKRSE